MSEIIGKWIQAEGQSFPGLWFEFRNDGSFTAEYEPMGIKSSGTFEIDGENITMQQTEHTLGFVGEFKGLFTVEKNQLKMVLSSNPGGPRPADLSEARIYIKE
ncbi:MAG TPA: hypothetical protein PLA02_06530 [Brevefilum fermentans]|jgi:hypothetical protein|nr:hypothetical protein [Brevefilum fermentans]